MVLITEFSSACSLETNPSVYCLEKQNAVFLRSHAFFCFVFLFLSSVFFFGGGRGGGLNSRYAAANSTSFTYWKTLGLFLSAEVLMPLAANIYIR